MRISIARILRALLPVVTLACSSPLASADEFDYIPTLPEGAERFASAVYTQSVFRLNDVPTIRAVPVKELEAKWGVAGGMEGIDKTTYTTVKYRYVPAAVVQGEPRRRLFNRIGRIGVVNSFGYTQYEAGIVRDYPVGTRFDELFVNAKTKTVFEHRVREKAADGWKSTVYHKDETARPDGYAGLKVTCSSCHAEAGTGKYGVGLVPGGDTVISDPLDWSVASGTVAIETQSSPIPQSMPPSKTPNVGPSAPMMAPAAPVFMAPTHHFEQRGLFGRRTVLVSNATGACAQGTSACAPGSATVLRQTRTLRLRSSGCP